MDQFSAEEIFEFMNDDANEWYASKNVTFLEEFNKEIDEDVASVFEQIQ